jgi:homocysteine S-methyltransferase
MNFFLSLPSNPNFEKIQKKVTAEPKGFMTQVIHSTDQVQRISNELRPKGFRIIPCILLPSEKNNNSAKFLELDWSNYKENLTNFIKQIYNISGDVLVTSPNDFTFAKETLKKI